LRSTSIAPTSLHLARAEDEVGAELGERLRHPATDAAAAAGHDRRLATEIEEVAYLHLRILQSRENAEARTRFDLRC
jgi:hypothetical protein